MREWMAGGAPNLELYVITPGDLLVAFVAWICMGLIAAGFGWWLRGGVKRRPNESQPAGDGADPDRTVEIRYRRRRPPRTGTIHAPGVAVPPDETAVIDTGEASR